MPSCSPPSRTPRAAEAVARRRAILDRRCARRHIARAGRDGRMVPIEQKDWTEEDRASKLGQNHPLDSTKRQNLECRRKFQEVATIFLLQLQSLFLAHLPTAAEGGRSRFIHWRCLGRAPATCRC